MEIIRQCVRKVNLERAEVLYQVLLLNCLREEGGDLFVARVRRILDFGREVLGEERDEAVYAVCSDALERERVPFDGGL